MASPQAFPALLAAASALTASLALAGGAPADAHPGRGAQPVLPPCQCRALGREWDMGEEICLDLGKGRLAYACAMHQNVTSWRETGRRCPES